MLSPGASSGGRSDIPALDHCLQEAALEKTLPMGPAQIARPDRDNAFPLQLLQGFKGFGQFFFGTCYHCCPDVKGLAARGRSTVL